MQKWVNELKAAIIEDDLEKVASLSQDIPASSDKALLQEASHLMQKAIEMGEEKKTLLSKEIIKLRNAKKYIA